MNMHGMNLFSSLERHGLHSSGIRQLLSWYCKGRGLTPWKLIRRSDSGSPCNSSKPLLRVMSFTGPRGCATNSEACLE